MDGAVPHATRSEGRNQRGRRGLAPAMEGRMPAECPPPEGMPSPEGPHLQARHAHPAEGGETKGTKVQPAPPHETGPLRGGKRSPASLATGYFPVTPPSRGSRESRPCRLRHAGFFSEKGPPTKASVPPKPRQRGRRGLAPAMEGRMPSPRRMPAPRRVPPPRRMASPRRDALPRRPALAGPTRSSRRRREPRWLPRPCPDRPRR